MRYHLGNLLKRGLAALSKPIAGDLEWVLPGIAWLLAAAIVALLLTRWARDEPGMAAFALWVPVVAVFLAAGIRRARSLASDA